MSRVQIMICDIISSHKRLQKTLHRLSVSPAPPVTFTGSDLIESNEYTQGDSRLASRNYSAAPEPDVSLVTSACNQLGAMDGSITPFQHLGFGMDYGARSAYDRSDEARTNYGNGVGHEGFYVRETVSIGQEEAQGWVAGPQEVCGPQGSPYWYGADRLEEENPSIKLGRLIMARAAFFSLDWYLETGRRLISTASPEHATPFQRHSAASHLPKGRLNAHSPPLLLPIINMA